MEKLIGITEDKEVVVIKESINDVVLEYKAMQKEIKALEEAMKPLKERLEAEALKAGGSLETGTFTIKLIEASREIFNLKDGKAALGSALTPFIKETHYTQLRIS